MRWKLLARWEPDAVLLAFPAVRADGRLCRWIREASDLEIDWERER